MAGAGYAAVWQGVEWPHAAELLHVCSLKYLLGRQPIHCCFPCCPLHLQMLRLEPHIVVSNRTPVPLQLLQTRLALASPPPLVTAASSRGQQPRPQGAVVAEGGHSFSSVASSGFFTSPLWTGGGLVDRGLLA